MRPASQPQVRYAALNRVLDLGRTLGIDPARLMREEGLDPAGLQRPDAWIPARAAVRLLERCAAESGHEDFGLLLAELRQLSTIGPLSLVLRDEVDLRSAFRLLLRYEHSYNEALRMSMDEQSDLATIRLRLELGEDLPCRQAVELGIGALHGILREFLGPQWQAVGVSFPHGAPRAPTAHERVLGPGVAFDQEFAGIVLYDAELATPIASSDPVRQAYVEQFVKSLGAPRDATTTDRVREMIELMLPSGRCSADQVARDLGMDRRTLHRHLRAGNQTFSSLVDEARAEAAERYLLSGRYSMTDVSDMLGFAASSGLSRWFRQHYGCSPSDWLAAQG